MQCTDTSCWGWVTTSATFPPKLKLKVAQTQTHFEKKYDDASYDVKVKVPLPSHVQSITSTSNPFVKHCLKLRHNSSYRHSHGSVLVVGATPIRYSCQSFSLLISIYLGGFLCCNQQAQQPKNSNGYLLFFLKLCFRS